MSKVMISLPGDFLRDVDALARTEHRSRSELVREAIRTYLATTAVHHSAAERQTMQRAAKRILSAHLRLPKGHTAASLVRQMRETRYGATWKTS